MEITFECPICKHKNNLIDVDDLTRDEDDIPIDVNFYCEECGKRFTISF